jgi:hypothetical protein
LTPGTILHDQKFPFSDGTTGNKLVVLLTSLTDGFFILGQRQHPRRNTKEKMLAASIKIDIPIFIFLRAHLLFLLILG